MWLVPYKRTFSECFMIACSTLLHVGTCELGSWWHAGVHMALTMTMANVAQCLVNGPWVLGRLRLGTLDAGQQAQWPFSRFTCMRPTAECPTCDRTEGVITWNTNRQMVHIQGKLVRTDVAILLSTTNEHFPMGLHNGTAPVRVPRTSTRKAAGGHGQI